MKKEELIKKIGDVVMKNSKKGILTLTKFVGTYNYKSGYDSFFAVSVDTNNTLIVYSYYQNDRGEHIDTLIYKLDDLPENEINEVYKNLNTDDEKSIQYAAWSDIEDKNLEILIANGIYKQPKKKDALIDVNSIPELENEKDAYWVDRDENVGVMKFRGTTPIGEIIYEVVGKGFIDRPYYIDRGARLFHETNKYQKNKGVFLLVDGDNNDNNTLMFVPDKKKLLDLANRERNIKTYYIVNNDLSSLKKTRDSKPEVDKKKATIFEDKNEAVSFINKKKQKFIKKYTALLEKVIMLKEEVSNAIGGVSFDVLKNNTIEAKNYEPGVKYYQSSFCGDSFSELPFTITSVEKSTELLFTDNGFVLKPSDKLITVENVENIKQIKKYKGVSKYMNELDRSIKLLNHVIKLLNEYVPFNGGEVQFPEWVEEEIKKIIKKKSSVLKKVVSTVASE